MEPNHDAPGGERIDTLIARANFLEALRGQDTGSAMPAPLLTQLLHPSAVAATPAPWSCPLLTLCLLVATGGALSWLTLFASGDAGPAPALSLLLSWLIAGLSAAATGRMVGQARPAGLRLAKWLPRLAGASCVGQLAMVAFALVAWPVWPALIGLAASALAIGLINTPAFSGFVTYRLLLRQARWIQTGACPRAAKVGR